MIKIFLCCVALALVACVPAASPAAAVPVAPAAVPVAAAAPTPPRNLAVDFVNTIEPDAKCVAFFAGEGPTLTYSTVCRMPNKTSVYCSLSSDKTPGCVVVDDPRAPPPSPQPAPPQPAAAVKRAPTKGP